MKAFDHMIAEDLYKYHADPWCHAEKADNFYSMEGVEDGQVDYKGEIFVVTHRSGGGGGHGGYPDSVNIIRIKK